MAFTNNLFEIVICITSLTAVIIIPSVRCVGTTDNNETEVGYSEENEHDNGSFPPEEHKSEHGGHGVHLAKWNFDYVMGPLLITAYALFVGIAKVGFHHASFLSSWLPESSLLIIIGGIMGGISYALDHPLGQYSFESKTFFLFLLPPIILESAFSLHDRTFTSNIGSILVYAVAGTLLNTFIVGPLLYGLSFTGAFGMDFTITITQCLVFSALISAVDPVAVLAIFEEVHVNNVLYFLVFGESLLNDAITVVLYNMMNSFATMSTVPVSQIFLGLASFFTISVGAIMIGTIVGVLTAIFTKYTDKVRVVEPLALLGMAYLSYMLAELFHFSGIISIICCGLVQKEYAFDNVSRKSHTTIKYFTKMLSTTTEAIIFLQLGDILWNVDHNFNPGFVFLTLIIILLSRGLITLSLSFILNKVRTVKLNLQEQFIMSYGGLRGAVAFALVVLLDEKYIPMRSTMITTTLIVVFFTVFIQGGTIKPLVKWMHIRRSEEKEESLSDTIHTNVLDFMMAGIEEIAGHRGHNYFRVLTDYYDAKYLRPWLQRKPTNFETEVMNTFENITLRDHQEHVYNISNAPGVRLRNKASLEMGDETTPALSQIGNQYSLEIPPDDTANTLSLPKEKIRPTSQEFNKIVKKNPGILIHRTHDKNLLQDDHQDLAEQMHHHHRRHMLLRQRVLSRGSSVYPTTPTTLRSHHRLVHQDAREVPEADDGKRSSTEDVDTQV
ncbi:sodium/hydrogen exchanger 2-like [Amphiura filiformis]|uniref:sodium/hydrogen exchanger 2-like n=1 Tax=Amphiura filiformis TaxID=82378 RepID=UPI003B21A118